MVFFHCVELLPSRLLPSLAFPPNQVLVAGARSRGAAVLSHRRSTTSVFPPFSGLPLWELLTLWQRFVVFVFS